MSSRVTRKRARVAEQDEDLLPLDQDDGGVGGPNGPQLEVDLEEKEIEEHDFKKDEEFWFEDGTVIIVARDTEFRVYEGLLAGLSPVFRGLFAESHELRILPMRGGQTLSCPIVGVSDSPEDLRHLFRACFSRRLGSLYKEREPSYHEISATIRLGNKYQLAELYSQSLDYLKSYFPSTLDRWDALEDYVPPGWQELEAIGVVNLARLTGELSILPAALVVCICGESEDGENDSGIVYGIAREDGFQEVLSPRDLSICFQGKTSLRTATIAAFLRTFDPTACRGCKTSADCRRALRNVLLSLEDELEGLLEGDPFAEYHKFTGFLSLCRSCTTAVEKQSLKERKLVWDRLPELLGVEVPGWKPEPPPGAVVSQ
uniref:Malate synthase (EC) n=1 Tax=Ganoderma boninense TaxID=34458 RepID=A0A5K1K6G2_9APHY|nr:Malate synthase (EC [Ganoderma boninense]